MRYKLLGLDDRGTATADAKPEPREDLLRLERGIGVSSIRWRANRTRCAPVDASVWTRTGSAGVTAAVTAVAIAFGDE